MYETCEECGAPLSIGQGSAEVEIDSLKMEVEQLQSELSAARALVSRPRAELQEEVESLRTHNHHLRGLLETAVDAYECGHWNGLLCMKQLHLTQAWWDEAAKAGGDDE